MSTSRQNPIRRGGLVRSKLYRVRLSRSLTLPAMTARCERLAGRPVASEMLHLGVDTDQFRGGLCSERSELRAQLKISDDDVLLSSMRALTPLYNHDLILDAFAQSLPQLRRKAYLLFKAFNAQPPLSRNAPNARHVNTESQIEFDLLTSCHTQRCHLCMLLPMW